MLLYENVATINEVDFDCFSVIPSFVLFKSFVNQVVFAYLSLVTMAFHLNKFLNFSKRIYAILG